MEINDVNQTCIGAARHVKPCFISAVFSVRRASLFNQLRWYGIAVPICGGSDCQSSWSAISLVKFCRDPRLKVEGKEKKEYGISYSIRLCFVFQRARSCNKPLYNTISLSGAVSGLRLPLSACQMPSSLPPQTVADSHVFTSEPRAGLAPSTHRGRTSSQSL